MNNGLLVVALSVSLLCSHSASAQQTDPSEPAPMVDPKLEPPPGSNVEPFDVTPPKEPAGRLPIPGIVLIGIGAAGIAIGIAGAAVSGHQGTIAENGAKEILKGHGLCQPVVGSYAARCKDVADAAKLHNTWQKVARGGLAVGIAAAAAGVIYLLWPEGRPKTKRNIESSSAWSSINPIIAPHALGLEWSGIIQ